MMDQFLRAAFSAAKKAGLSVITSTIKEEFSGVSIACVGPTLATLGKQPQGKLVRVVQGEVFDVAVDLRKSSPTFGKWAGEILSAENKKQLWVPEGFAHGFLVLSETAEFLYKTTDYYAPEYERCLAWNDATVAIRWPIASDLALFTKDQQGKSLNGAECFA